jgi:glutamate synthase (NADPH/NADH) large chain
MAMVDLEPIPSENQAMEQDRHQGGDLESHGLVDFSDMTQYDEQRLHRLIENHLHYTGSTRAREILDDWSDYLPKFVKVMPVEYRRALQEMARQQSADPTGFGELEIGLQGNGK